MDMERMTSSKPYMIKAIYDWISDNGLTPYILVNSRIEGVRVPEQYIDNGKIILNVSADAVSNFHQDNEWILFNARFSGKRLEICIPMSSVMAIYAKENGKGMVLDDGDEQQPAATQAEQSVTKKSPKLQLVK